MVISTLRLRLRQVAGFGAGVVLVTILVVGGLLLRNWRLRYELTIEVETPDGPRRGSSIIEVTVKRSVPFWGASGIHHQIRGSAPVIELPDGRLVFALLQASTNAILPQLAVRDTHALPTIADRMNRMDTGTFWSHLRARRPDLRVDAEMMSRRIGPFAGARYPAIVVVDRADAKPIRAIDPANAADVLGPGFSLTGLVLRIVDTPPDTADDPPWLPGVSQALDDLASSGLPRLSLDLTHFFARGGK